MRNCYSSRHSNGREYFRTTEEELVEALTNWQRKQWARAGHPRDPGELRRFARLQRDGIELHTGEVIPPRPCRG